MLVIFQKQETHDPGVESEVRSSSPNGLPFATEVHIECISTAQGTAATHFSDLVHHYFTVTRYGTEFLFINTLFHADLRLCDKMLSFRSMGHEFEFESLGLGTFTFDLICLA